MLVRPTLAFAASLSLALLGAACSLTTDLSGLQQGAGGDSSAASSTSAQSTTTTATTTTSAVAATATSTSTGSGGPVCGDGVIQAGEECDDGNGATGDGCAACVVECGGKHEFKDPKTFHCYYYDDFSDDTFAEATAFCAGWRKNATLAAITSSEEAFFLTVTKGVESNTWIGATDLVKDNEYQWVTGEPWGGYTNWAPGYPMSSSFLHCVNLGVQNLKWENCPCEITNITLCESSPAGKTAP